MQAQDIARLFRELKGGENGSAWIIASARRLRMSGLDWQNQKNDSGAFVLPTSAYEQAKKAAPGLDVYYLETEWRDWTAKKPPATNLAGAFVEFCRGKYQGNKGSGGLSRGMP